MRKLFKYNSVNPNDFLEKLIASSTSEKHFTLLCSGGNVANRVVKNEYEWVASIGAIKTISPQKNSFSELKSFVDEANDWLFGYLSYDLKNELELLSSKNDDGLEFPEMEFVQPEIVLIKNNKVIECHYISSVDIKSKLHDIENTTVSESETVVNFQSKISKNKYIDDVEQLLHHIRLGNVYEINYCQEFFATPASFNPQTTYLEILNKFPTPFSCFVKNSSHYILSASPERFLKKEGNKLFSQPIKGTIHRGETEVEDNRLAAELLANDKERSENVMIVDLVRNDLSKVATTGSVNVEELFGIYSYQTVHQMISTVSAEIDKKCHPVDAIESCFPMGSMTGAPKVKAMQLIEEFEQTKRGVYSGAVGYFSPNGNFDFNVIIRTLLYNDDNNYLSLMAGSAITSQSNPHKEYEESLLKAQAFFDLVGAPKAKINA
ncbi:MAG: anthranilate synthase component I family protein [Flavobacteriales bacterium]|nr:anthranilate synthase component I family protein [Flavobacteriales bacterium]